ATLGDHAYAVIQELADNPANAGLIATINTLLNDVTAIYDNAAHTTKALRDAAVDALMGGASADTKTAIKVAMQQDKPLLEAQQALGNNTYALFTGVNPLRTNHGVYNDGIRNTIEGWNTLLAAVKLIYATHYDYKAERDAAIDGLGTTDSNKDPLKNAMQQDNPLLFGQAESGLEQAVYDVIVNNRGARSVDQLNQVIEAVAQAINDNPQKNAARDGAITAAGGADAGFTTAIMNAVDTEYPAFKVFPAYPGDPNNRLLLLLSNAADAAPLGKVKAINALADEVFAKIIEDDGTGKDQYNWKDYPSQTRREMAIDDIAEQLFIDAGITKQAVKDALNQDRTLIQITRGEDTGLNVRTYNVITLDPYLTNVQIERLIESILDAAKLRPRIKNNRDAAVEAAVKSVLGVVDLTGVGHQAIADKIKAALEAWQKTEGYNEYAVSYVLQDRGVIPQATYNRIVNYIDTTAANEYEKLINPSNDWVNFMLGKIKTEIYDARPQPKTITDMQKVVSSEPLFDPWMIPWDTEIKNALAAPESGLVDLDPKPSALAQTLYDHVTSLALTNAEKNHLLQALANARAQDSNIRLQTIMTAADNVGLDNPAKRSLLTEFFKSSPTIVNGKSLNNSSNVDSNINGVARKFKVIKLDASRITLKKVAVNNGPEQLGSQEYKYNPNDVKLQGIPVEASDYVWFKASELTGPEGNALFWNSHL
ncbi:MAG: hypothetical protein KC505_05690, partial [Myxococcales bacterium]|nr:hypothetical protein [Myxococcales bacterium]